MTNSVSKVHRNLADKKVNQNVLLPKNPLITDVKLSAGDFKQYDTKEDIFKNGWSMIKAEMYDFDLVDVTQGEIDVSDKAKKAGFVSEEERRRNLALDSNKVVTKAITLKKK